MNTDNIIAIKKELEQLLKKIDIRLEELENEGRALSSEHEKLTVQINALNLFLDIANADKEEIINERKQSTPPKKTVKKVSIRNTSRNTEHVSGCTRSTRCG